MQRRSRRLHGKAPEITSEQVIAIQNRVQRAMRRARVVIAAAKVKETEEEEDDNSKKNEPILESVSGSIASASSASTKILQNRSVVTRVADMRANAVPGPSVRPERPGIEVASANQKNNSMISSAAISSPATGLGLLAGVSGAVQGILTTRASSSAISTANDIPNIQLNEKNTFRGPKIFMPQKNIDFGKGILNVVDFQVGPCSCGLIGPVLYLCPHCSGVFRSNLMPGDAIKQIKMLPSHIDQYDSDDSSDDSSDSDCCDSDSSNDTKPSLKKRVKLVAKKAGGPGASVKRLLALEKSVRPKKRLKRANGIISYSRKELRKSQRLSLKNFMKAKIIFKKTEKTTKLQKNSFVVNSAGMPIGTKMNAMNTTYKVWATV